MERMEELLILSQQFDFKEVRRAVPLISASRWLVKRLEKVTRISWREGALEGGHGSVTVAKLTFGRRVNRQSLCLFLFTDMLVITKRKRCVGIGLTNQTPTNPSNLFLLQRRELSGGRSLPEEPGHAGRARLGGRRRPQRRETLVRRVHGVAHPPSEPREQDGGMAHILQVISRVKD